MWPATESINRSGVKTDEETGGGTPDVNSSRYPAQIYSKVIAL